MIVPLKPPLEGISAERFLGLAQALSRKSKGTAKTGNPRHHQSRHTQYHG